MPVPLSRIARIASTLAASVSSSRWLSVAAAQSPKARDFSRGTDASRDDVLPGLPTGWPAINRKCVLQAINQHALNSRDAGAVSVKLARYSSIAIRLRRSRWDAVNGGPLLDELLSVARDHSPVSTPVPDGARGCQVAQECRWLVPPP